MLKILTVVAGMLALSSCLLVPVGDGYGHDRYGARTSHDRREDSDQRRRRERDEDERYRDDRDEEHHD